MSYFRLSPKRLLKWRWPSRREALLLSALALSLLLNLGLLIRPALAQSDRSQVYQQALEYVRYHLRHLYVEEISEEQLMLGAVRGAMAATGDPYTRFLDAEENREFSGMAEGRRVGVGIEVTLLEGVPVVIAPIGGGPAARAGVQAGDRIVAIDGVKTENQSFAEMLARIGGEIGSVVELTLDRAGFPEPVQIRIVRGEFEIDYVRPHYFEERRVGYIRLLHFFGQESGAVDEFRAALQDFQRRGARAVIVDLRNNPGGRLDMAAILAGYFLKSNQLVVSARGRSAEMSQEYRVQGVAHIVPDEWKVCVLINEGSASASEIFAGALQDHKRASLVGARSFGKASVQRVIRPLPGDTAALITVQRYFTPSGRTIHGLGLKPDIEVAAPRPGPAEQLALFRLERDGYFERLKKENPTYSDALAQTLRGEFTRRELDLSIEAARLVLRQVYRIQNGDHPEVEVDPQLARAIQELSP